MSNSSLFQWIASLSTLKWMLFRIPLQWKNSIPWVFPTLIFPSDFSPFIIVSFFLVCCNSFSLLHFQTEIHFFIYFVYSKPKHFLFSKIVNKKMLESAKSKHCEYLFSRCMRDESELQRKNWKIIFHTTLGWKVRKYGNGKGTKTFFLSTSFIFLSQTMHLYLFFHPSVFSVCTVIWFYILYEACRKCFQLSLG